MPSSKNRYKTRSTTKNAKSNDDDAAQKKKKLIEGINEGGDKYLDNYNNDELIQLIKSIVPGVRVSGKKKPLLVQKLKRALGLVSILPTTNKCTRTFPLTLTAILLFLSLTQGRVGC